MIDTKQAHSIEQWTTSQAYVFAVICLLVGIAAGWFIRGSQNPAAAATQAASASAPGMGNANGAAPVPTPAQMQQMADTQAAPLLEKLKADPTNTKLLENVGDIYYDAHLFPASIDYYQRSLKIDPANTGARTDMGTAYWYSGNPDAAIEQFQKSLTYEPTKASTLFNLGIVEWQGKMDINKAVATWQHLLDTNPNYEGKGKVDELIAQAQKHSGVKPGTPAKPLQ